MVVGLFTSYIVQPTFATEVDKKPNVIITINSDGSITQEGSLFANGLLYPSNVEDAEKGIGGISGVIRINNQYSKIVVDSLGLGIKEDEIEINNQYPRSIVYNSFLDNVSMKIQKGIVFKFNRTLIDYTNLRSLLYEPGNEEYRGQALSRQDEFHIGKGKTVDLKYTLHMAWETKEELESVKASVQVYINVHEKHISKYET